MRERQEPGSVWIWVVVFLLILGMVSSMFTDLPVQGGCDALGWC